MRCILGILALTVSAVFGQNNRSAVSLTGSAGGHNFVDGNTTETAGTIVPVPTM